MIHLVMGRQGSGKTLFMVKKAYETFLRGGTVYSNIKLKFPYKPINIKDIIECKLEDGIVVWDEVHIYLSSRRSMSKASRLICDGFLSMVRKKNLEVYGSTQLLRKVDVRFREEADFYYSCHKFIAYNGKWSISMDNVQRNKEMPIMIMYYVQENFSGSMLKEFFMGNDYFKLFNTREIVMVKGLEDV